MQDIFETVLNRPVHLVCQQDNASVIQIVHGGYSAKLRHLKKVHKLNLSASMRHLIFQTFCFNILSQQVGEQTRSQRHWNHANGHLLWSYCTSDRLDIFLKLECPYPVATCEKGEKRSIR
jgi:hypothetical protein